MDSVVSVWRVMMVEAEHDGQSGRLPRRRMFRNGGLL